MPSSCRSDRKADSSSSACPRPAAAKTCRPRPSPLPDLHHAARPHRQFVPTARWCRRRGSCATTATIPIWWWRPTRARPRSPTSRTASRRGADSGWAMRSRPAAAMATTTRKWRSRREGAWEAVKRHFREIGRDIQTRGLHLVGVGDMSGDVFGNGMLLSRISSSSRPSTIGTSSSIRIPIRPAILTERQRLFDLPRSSWADYDKEQDLDRRRHFPRARQRDRAVAGDAGAVGIEAAKLAPGELISALLKRRVDLLWFGGIGTYVKASAEPIADVGDRANDALRVDGNDVARKVVGEGANLGVHAAGPRRVCVERQPAQHRCDRQFGRRR